MYREISVVESHFPRKKILNYLIEKQFQKASKELSQSTREKIQNVLKKIEKKTK